MEPAVASIIFFAIVIGFCEICRRILDVLYGEGVRPPRSVKGFLTEALATLQTISCVYENQLIAKNYGLIGFGLAVFVLLNLHRLTNRGSIASPPALLERLILGRLKFPDAVAVLLAELAGAALAFRLAYLVWKLGITSEHVMHADTFDCVVSHKVPLTYVAAYEFVAVFFIRSLVGLSTRRTPRWTPYVAATAVSVGIPIGFALVGPVALNPINAFGRLGGCKGLHLSQHLLTYWLAPTCGWVAALLVEQAIADRTKKIR